MRATASADVTPPAPMTTICRSAGSSDAANNVENPDTFPSDNACIASPARPPTPGGTANSPVAPSTWSANTKLFPSVLVHVKNAIGFTDVPDSGSMREYVAMVCTTSAICVAATYGGSLTPIVRLVSFQKNSARTSRRVARAGPAGSYDGGAREGMLGQLVLSSTAMRDAHPC